MRLSRLLPLVGSLSVCLAQYCLPPRPPQGDIDSGKHLKQLADIALQNAMSNLKGSCTKQNVKKRQEYRTLTTAQKKNFISAIKCIQTKRSLFPAGQVPGSKGLFEDFAAVHINQTLFIHYSAYFLTWHRYFVHTYEQALRNCGYTGNMPYWEWGLDVAAPQRSPIFDGSDTSLGGDGTPIPHAGLLVDVPITGLISMKPGTGGGCVTKGPFANMVTRLGPVQMPQYGNATSIGVANPYADNSRCLKRDLNADPGSRWSSFRNVTDLIRNYNNIELFQAYMQGDGRYVPATLGPHGGGHYMIGGDPGSDPFISPGDPAFYLHHAQVDRVYWIWQQMDLANRQGVFGTGTILDFPPSANVTVNDYLDITPLNVPVQIKNVMNTVTNSPLCYVYV